MPDRQALWSILDRWEVPFRSTGEQLVAACGVQPASWGGPDWSECVLPIGPEFPVGFRRGFSFLVLPGDDLSMPPRRFTTELRRWPVAGWIFAQLSDA